MSGGFDDFRSRHMRFLHEASRLGALHVVLWPGRSIEQVSGKPPKMPLAERRYLLQSLRYVTGVAVPERMDDPDALPEDALSSIGPDIWAIDEEGDSAKKRAFCGDRGIRWRVIARSELGGFPEITRRPDDTPTGGGRSEGSPAPRPGKKVVVTGCFDWFHSGHVRFFEEVSELGDLYVIIGHDENVRMLKGEGHPLFPQEERRYMAAGVRFVKEALVSTGHGWLDAEPEIRKIRPDIYAVNEDGDKPEKRRYCREHGIEYVVLKRLPKEGLPARQSTKLRGF